METDGTTIHYRNGFKVVEVDTKKATFKGMSWRDLGSFGKKKFENVVFLKNARNEKGLRTKILYA